MIRASKARFLTPSRYETPATAVDRAGLPEGATRRFLSDDFKPHDPTFLYRAPGDRKNVSKVLPRRYWRGFTGLAFDFNLPQYDGYGYTHPRTWDPFRDMMMNDISPITIWSQPRNPIGQRPAHGVPSSSLDDDSLARWRPEEYRERLSARRHQDFVRREAEARADAAIDAAAEQLKLSMEQADPWRPLAPRSGGVELPPPAHGAAAAAVDSTGGIGPDHLAPEVREALREAGLPVDDSYAGGSGQTDAPDPAAERHLSGADKSRKEKERDAEERLEAEIASIDVPHHASPSPPMVSGDLPGEDVRSGFALDGIGPSRQPGDAMRRFGAETGHLGKHFPHVTATWPHRDPSWAPATEQDKLLARDTTMPSRREGATPEDFNTHTAINFFSREDMPAFYRLLTLAERPFKENVVLNRARAKAIRETRVEWMRNKARLRETGHPSVRASQLAALQRHMDGKPLGAFEILALPAGTRNRAREAASSVGTAMDVSVLSAGEVEMRVKHGAATPVRLQFDAEAHDAVFEEQFDREREKLVAGAFLTRLLRAPTLFTIPLLMSLLVVLPHAMSPTLALAAWGMGASYGAAPWIAVAVAAVASVVSVTYYGHRFKKHTIPSLCRRAALCAVWSGASFTVAFLAGLPSVGLASYMAGFYGTLTYGMCALSPFIGALLSSSRHMVRVAQLVAQGDAETDAYFAAVKAHRRLLWTRALGMVCALVLFTFILLGALNLVRGVFYRFPEVLFLMTPNDVDALDKEHTETLLGQGAFYVPPNMLDKPIDRFAVSERRDLSEFLAGSTGAWMRQDTGSPAAVEVVGVVCALTAGLFLATARRVATQGAQEAVRGTMSALAQRLVAAETDLSAQTDELAVVSALTRASAAVQAREAAVSAVEGIATVSAQVTGTQRLSGPSHGTGAVPHGSSQRRQAGDESVPPRAAANSDASDDPSPPATSGGTEDAERPESSPCEDPPLPSSVKQP